MAEKDYSATPLWKKLGMNTGSRVNVIGAPAHFRSILGALPDGVRIANGAPKSPTDVIVVFEKKDTALAKHFRSLKPKLDPAGGLWIAYPKKSSAIATDVTFETVQGAGLAAGLVDNKGCAIDEDWTALRFVFRLKDRPRASSKPPKRPR